MARKDKELVVRERFTQYLEPGEQIYHVGYGVKQPHIGLIILFVAIAVLPGMLVVMLMTKHYYVALTDRRLIVIQFSGKTDKNVMSFTPGQLGGPLTTKFGGIFTHLKIDNPQQKLTMKFHRAGLPNNRPASQAICTALEQAQNGQVTPNPAMAQGATPPPPPIAEGATPPPVPPTTDVGENNDETTA